MKTTLELPDDLFVEAKTVAAKRRITLKELFTKALENEIRPQNGPNVGKPEGFSMDAHGWPVFKKKDYTGPGATNELVNQLREQEGI